MHSEPKSNKVAYSIKEQNPKFSLMVSLAKACIQCQNQKPLHLYTKPLFLFSLQAELPQGHLCYLTRSTADLPGCAMKDWVSGVVEKLSAEKGMYDLHY